ncbi:MAG: hypothetical protein WKG07_34755 [Hymenobacter sp.]
MALTATADRLTQRDIITQLNLREPKVFLSSFDRPNINLHGAPRPGPHRARCSTTWAATRSDAGIIYCLSRKSCETICPEASAEGH